MFHMLHRELDGICFRQDAINQVADRFVSLRSDEHLIESEDRTGTIPPLACRFSKECHDHVAVADEDGALMIVNTACTGQNALKYDWRAHENAIFDLAWVPAGSKLVTASGDKVCKLWDVATQQELSAFKGHSSSVKTVSFSEDSHDLFASGSRDGHIMLWDIRVKQKGDSVPSVNMIKNPHAVKQVVTSRKKRKTDNTRDLQFGVTCVLFQDEHTLISAGSCDGDVKVWDLRKTYTGMKTLPISRDVFPYARTTGRSFGISSLALDSTRTRLFASCMDSVIYQFDCAAFNKSPVCTYRGHQMSSFYIRLSLSPDDALLLSGSSDSHAYIWPLNNPTTPVVLEGHMKEVCDVTWCPRDAGRLVTTSDDCTVRVWRADPLWASDGQQYETGMVIGKAKRTHRDIGVSTDSSAAASAHKNALVRRTASSHRRRTVTSQILPSRILPSRSCSPRKRGIPQSPRRSSPRIQTPQKALHHYPDGSVQNTKSPARRYLIPRRLVADNSKCLGVSPISANGLASSEQTHSLSVGSPSKGASINEADGQSAGTQFYPLSPSKSLRSVTHVTPRKRSLPPASPPKLSEQMKSALESLTKNHKPEAGQVKQKAKPLTLQSWLAGGKQKTPKKINITPRKIQPSSPGSKVKEETSSSSQRRVKRKLTDCYGVDLPNTKRTKQNEENEPGSVDNKQVVHTATELSEAIEHKIVANERISSNICDKERTIISSSERVCFEELDNIKSHGIDNKTPLKQNNLSVLSSPHQYRSPTMNLPNYVMNPEPRTPIGRVIKTPIAKTPDWLTQIKQGREKIASPKQLDPVPEEEATHKTPLTKSRSEDTSKIITPRSARSKKTPLNKKGSASILQYLSQGQ